MVSPNYEPISIAGTAREDKSFAWDQFAASGKVGRYPLQHPNTPFEQPRALWEKVFTETDRAHLIANLAGPLGAVTRKDI